MHEVEGSGAVVSVSGDKRGGLGFLPLHMPTSQEMLPRASVEGAQVGATGRNPMDPAQPAALSPLEGGKGRGEGKREQRNWNSLLTFCLSHRRLLCGLGSSKAPSAQAGGQAHSGTVRG